MVRGGGGKDNKLIKVKIWYLSCYWYIYGNYVYKFMFFYVRIKINVLYFFSICNICVIGM